MNPTVSVFAPLTGRLIDLSEVPDTNFSNKSMGDGVAIIPEDGILYSPVNGFVTSVAKDKEHSFTFQTEDGVDILVQVGTNTMNMDNKAISVDVREGARVQAGDLVATIDLEKIKKAGCNIITPVIICGGMEGFIMHPGSGHVLAGAGAVFTLEDIRHASTEEVAAAEKRAAEAAAKLSGKPMPSEEGKKKKKKKKKLDKAEQVSEATEFLKKPGSMLKLGIALAVVTALMVACFVSIAMFTMSE